MFEADRDPEQQRQHLHVLFGMLFGHLVSFRYWHKSERPGFRKLMEIEGRVLRSKADRVQIMAVGVSSPSLTEASVFDQGYYLFRHIVSDSVLVDSSEPWERAAGGHSL